MLLQTYSPLLRPLSRPPAPGDRIKSLQFLVCTLDYNDFVGQLAIGRIVNGCLRVVTPSCSARAMAAARARASASSTFEGLKRLSVQAAGAGDIIALAGIADITIGFPSPTRIIHNPCRPSRWMNPWPWSSVSTPRRTLPVVRAALSPLGRCVSASSKRPNITWAFGSKSRESGTSTRVRTGVNCSWRFSSR